MRYRSVCSGIEAATVAWEPLGWTPLSFSEIEPFPCSLLSYRFANVPNLGDMTLYKEWPDDAADAATELVVGGTPCQSFSVAGLRRGLDDPRGNLTLTYLGVVARYRPRWIVWENVPGVLSDKTGAFAAFLGGLAELGYGWAYRVLDAQFFGVPQRRRRVFVVGHLGDWRRSAAVLFERESLCGNPPPRREAGKRTAGTIAARTRGGGGLGTDFDCDGGVVCSSGSTAYCLNAGGMGRLDYESETLLAHALRADGFDASEDGTGRGTPIIPIDMRQASRGDKMTNNRNEGSSGGPPGTGIGEAGDPSPTIASSHIPAVAFTSKDYGADAGSISPTLRAMEHSRSHPNSGGQVAVLNHCGVRRLTPRECERLQGFPDDWTLVPHRGKPAADGPRYKSLGNSFAVPVVRWIGERIAFVDGIPQ